MTEIEYAKYEAKAREALQELEQVQQWLAAPQWPFVERVLEDVRAATIEELKSAKEVERLFHLQGRLAGLDVLENLPTEVRTRAQEILRGIEAAKAQVWTRQKEAK